MNRFLKMWFEFVMFMLGWVLVGGLFAMGFVWLSRGSP